MAMSGNVSKIFIGNADEDSAVPPQVVDESKTFRTLVLKRTSVTILIPIHPQTNTRSEERKQRPGERVEKHCVKE